MWDALAAAYPDRRMLLIFHQRRIRDIEARHPGYMPWLEELRRAKALYATPVGSNDDWYWLYACVRAQVRGWGPARAPRRPRADAGAWARRAEARLPRGLRALAFVFPSVLPPAPSVGLAGAAW
jgi:hypothetical protein